MKTLTQEQLLVIVGGSINGQYYDELGMPRQPYPWEPLIFGNQP